MRRMMLFAAAAGMLTAVAGSASAQVIPIGHCPGGPHFGCPGDPWPPGTEPATSTLPAHRVGAAKAVATKTSTVHRRAGK